MPAPKIALTIAGSDPSGGAGFQADLRTFQSMGVYGISIPSVLTAQNTRGVSGIHELSVSFISEQLDTLLEDIRPDAMKTGMLYSAGAVQAVADKVNHYSLSNLVIDPVTVSSTGVMLIEEKAVDVMKGDLLPLAKVITPNIHEAELITGSKVRDEAGMKEAAVTLRSLGPEVVVITGGHLKDRALDLFFDGEEFLMLENEMLEGEYHGTGCVFSAAVTACIALGLNAKEAFIKAKDVTFTAMKNSYDPGKGMKILKM